MAMDIVFTPNQWREQAMARHSLPARLDWHGLAARLVAADACRRSLASGRAEAGGSFDATMARVGNAAGDGAVLPAACLSPAAGLPGANEDCVNPIASADGKTAGATKTSIAGRDEPGDRGWQ